MKQILFSLILLATVLPGCGESQSKRAASEAAQKAAARASALQAIATRHGAEGEWEAPFKTKERLGVYTYELQKVLIRPNGAPVILVGSLDDIISVGPDEYEIRGRQSLSVGHTIYFSLKCGGDRLVLLLARTPGFLDVIDEYAVAARVSRISKPMFKGSAEFSTEDEVRVPEVTVEPGDVVIAAGECLEVVRLDR